MPTNLWRHTLEGLAPARVLEFYASTEGDVVLAAEDTLRTYAASEVVVVAREGEFEREIAKLEDRLPVPLRRVVA